MKKKRAVPVSDIHSYIVFANIDDRDGLISGHRMILSDAQMKTIEDVVLSAPVQVLEEESYTLEDRT